MAEDRKNGLILPRQLSLMTKTAKVIALSLLALLASCSSTKFVPDGQYLLEDVRVTSDTHGVKGNDMKAYIRQKPNSKWFSLVKIPLYTYSLSGRDSTRLFNKFLRRIGEAPVIYDSGEAEQSRTEIEKAVRNLGYIRARVSTATTVRRGKRMTFIQLPA